MRQSMTGFASAQGAGLGLVWMWELRGVNGKGLDLRLRLPDWVEGLDPMVRAEISRVVSRGNIQISLKLNADGAEGALRVDDRQLAAVLDAMVQIEQEAMDRGLSLAPSTASDIVALRGVLTTESAEVDQSALRALLQADLSRAVADFVDMRQTEGAALADIVNRQLSEIEALMGAR